MDFADGWLQERLLVLIPVILSLTVHEWAHAYTAYRLGDDTAKHLGRLTLNPLAHLDPVGTVILPLLGVPFGWAKPVPINALRFRRRISMSGGMMLTAAAGPISNLLLAALCLAIAYAASRIFGVAAADMASLAVLLKMLLYINVTLALFNILPVPPLDGSYLADALMPGFLRPVWNRICGAGPWALIVLLVALQYGTGGALFGSVFSGVGRIAAWAGLS